MSSLPLASIRFWIKDAKETSRNEIRFKVGGWTYLSPISEEILSTYKSILESEGYTVSFTNNDRQEYINSRYSYDQTTIEEKWMVVSWI